MESDFRKELIRSNDAIQEPDSKLRKVLTAKGHNTKTAYVLHWIPEQLEDLYTVLISGSYLVDVEIAKYDNSKPPIVERSELKSYMHGLSKSNQVRLAVAKDLACTIT
ncbi:hypothetical protein [Microbulbifer variabilis]|uniref:hypothetical protein n=1 Tax=Microbulbifer variabilis TaxID=266805 RepID=UPI00037B699F|nr:hypothetical protein [Microbulbifer variabilis]